MVKINIIKPFRWSPDGNRVVDVQAGPREVPARCAEVALATGWGVPIQHAPANKASLPARNKARGR